MRSPDQVWKGTILSKFGSIEIKHGSWHFHSTFSRIQSIERGSEINTSFNLWVLSIILVPNLIWLRALPAIACVDCIVAFALNLSLSVYYILLVLCLNILQSVKIYLHLGRDFRIKKKFIFFSLSQSFSWLS